MMKKEKRRGAAPGAAARARLAARANVAKAMAHPSRLAIVERLAKGTACVCDLVALVGADISTVSRHLSVLKSAGIVAGERKGAWVHYRLRCPCVLQFLDCVEAVIREAAEGGAGRASGGKAPRRRARTS